MRTSIEIDDKLMKGALRLTGGRTRREAVEMGLRTLIRLLRLRRQEELRRLRGKLHWDGDLEAMRLDSSDVVDTGGFDPLEPPPGLRSAMASE